MARFSLGEGLSRQLVALINRLGLRMGVMDLKISPSGQVVWLEVNPQGQFLFAEALSGTPLVQPFADFLEREHKR
jgi:hypothetical protein